MDIEPVNLNFRHWGSGGKPLIILHGLFGSAANWQSAGRRLAGEWEVFALDLRNHGDSPHSPDFSYAALAADLEAFMERQRIARAVLLGHSLGGKVAMAFADRFPQKAERLIILDIAPRPYPADNRPIVEAMLQIDPSRLERRRDALEAMQSAIPPLATRQFLLKNLQRTNGHYRWKINLRAIDRHLEEISRGPHLEHPYPNPAAFLSGSDSRYIKQEDEGVIRRWYPNARIVRIEGAGHWLHADAQEQTIGVIEDFLRTDF